jgi:hypothetical protein
MELKMEAKAYHMGKSQNQWESMLFELLTDPGQETPLSVPVKEEEYIRKMVKLMTEYDAPLECYTRYGLNS